MPPKPKPEKNDEEPNDDKSKNKVGGGMKGALEKIQKRKSSTTFGNDPEVFATFSATSILKKDQEQGQGEQKEKQRRPTIRFDPATTGKGDVEAGEPPPSKGNFKHYKEKTSKYDYKDLREGKDRLFHVDLATECDTYFKAQRLRLKQRKTEHLAFIVDLDEYEYHKVIFHGFLSELLESAFFRVSILVLVLVNAILIGLQTEQGLSIKFATMFYLMDQFILSIFIFEILIKWIYDFRLFWKVGWNVLDFVIVSLVIVAAIMPVGFGNSRAIVIVRVVRAFRGLRSVSFLTSLTIVTRTIIRSVKEMGNILLVLLIFMVVISIMGVILFNIRDLDDDIIKRFLNGADTWFLVFICVTQDGWNEITGEFKESDEYFPVLALFLIVSVSIGAFIFANLIVAVIVANLELCVQQVRDEQRQTWNPLLSQSGMLEGASNLVDIRPVYNLLRSHRLPILSQRPMKIPSLRKISQRRIQAYITLIVALEQNMLEAEIIERDIEKILAVLLSVMFQLEIYTQQKAHREEEKMTYDEALRRAKKMFGTVEHIPPPTAGQEKYSADLAKKGYVPPTMTDMFDDDEDELGSVAGSEISQIPEVDEGAAALSFINLIKARKAIKPLKSPVLGSGLGLLPEATKRRKTQRIMKKERDRLKFKEEEEEAFLEVEQLIKEELEEKERKSEEENKRKSQASQNSRISQGSKISQGQAQGTQEQAQGTQERAQGTQEQGGGQGPPRPPPRQRSHSEELLEENYFT